MVKVMKLFEIEEGSTSNMWYKITIKSAGKVIQEFLRPTMEEAYRDLRLAGYHLYFDA